MNPILISSIIIIAIVSFYSGHYYKTCPQCPPPPLCPAQKPCPPPVKCPDCELNVTGIIFNNNSLFSQSRTAKIYFNGIEGISGVLDDQNGGHFVGTFKGKPSEAVCSGSEDIICNVKFDGKEESVSIKGK